MAEDGIGKAVVGVEDEEEAKGNIVSWKTTCLLMIIELLDKSSSLYPLYTKGHPKIIHFLALGENLVLCLSRVEA